tara:strand:+ start:403 stop:573 length:171 start_codon:yes stop_codon:yes gene_type:complete
MKLVTTIIFSPGLAVTLFYSHPEKNNEIINNVRDCFIFFSFILPRGVSFIPELVLV